VGLFEDNQITENLYDSAIPAEFADAINSSIRAHPYSRSGEDGLIHYFSDGNEAYEAFVRAHVKYAHPTVELIDGSLRLVLEVGSDCRLPENIVNAIADNMDEQCKNGWGQELADVDTPLRDIVLYEPDSIIGLRSDMEQRYPDYHFRTLDNPSLGLYVCDAEWTATRDGGPKSVLEQIRQAAKAPHPEQTSAAKNQTLPTKRKQNER